MMVGSTVQKQVTVFPVKPTRECVWASWMARPRDGDGASDQEELYLMAGRSNGCWKGFHGGA